jgi:exodeoxyribonuclease X
MTIIAVVDTETTGIEKSDCLIELATVRFDSEAHSMSRYTSLFNPGIPIPAIASAIHHITDADVATAKPFATGDWQSATFSATVLAAHKADFDRTYLPNDDRPWICTYKCAAKEWPDAPSHTNQTLRYWLGLQPDICTAGYPHRALYDAIVTTELLKKLLTLVSIDELIETSSLPVLLPRVPFGKHRGQCWSAVPKDYIAWLLRQDNLDSNVAYTAKHWATK